MSEELKLQRTREQWARYEPKLMAQQSPAAIMYALQDAQRDIAALHRHADKLRAELSAIKGRGDAVAWMLADAVGGSMLEFQRDLLLESQCRYGGEIVPLYTHPPVVAEAEPVGLTFNALRTANAERIGSSRYRKCEENWTPAHWMQATVGELGELANLLKKVDRGDFPFDQVKTEVAKELADVQTYLDILALKLGVDLGQATIDKFNEVSERIGSHVRLAAPPASGAVPDPMPILKRLFAAETRKLREMASAEYRIQAMTDYDKAMDELRALVAKGVV